MSYDNTNSGVLWKNVNKKSENSPELSGEFTDDAGTLRFLYGRVARDKEGKSLLDKNGNTYLKIKVGEPKHGKVAPAPKPIAEEMDDEIPF